MVVVLEVVVVVAVVLAVAVKVLTPRTCPPHPMSIAAAGAVGRWFAVASSRGIFRLCGRRGGGRGREYGCGRRPWMREERLLG